MFDAEELFGTNAEAEEREVELDAPLLLRAKKIGTSFLELQKNKELRLQALKAELEAERNLLKKKEENLALISEVRVILQELSEKTRIQILSGLENVVRTYIQAVFGEEFDFEAVPEISRNKMAIEFWVIDRTDPNDILRMPPEGNMGGGLLDTVAIGLHFALIDMLPEELHGPVFFDEPSKMVSGDLIYRIGQLIKESQRIFELQVIMVTHHAELQEIFDNSIVLKKEKGVAYVVE